MQGTVGVCKGSREIICCRARLFEADDDSNYDLRGAFANLENWSLWRYSIADRGSNE